MNLRKILCSNIAYIFYIILLGVITKVTIKMVGKSHGIDNLIAILLMVILIGISGCIVYLTFKNRHYLKDKFNNLSLIKRRFIWGTLCWFTLVLSTVFIFSPYGGYMSDENWITTWKIILIPPALIGLGYLSYLKMVIGKGHD